MYVVCLRNGSTNEMLHTVQGRLQADRLRAVLSLANPSFVPPNGYYVQEVDTIDAREVDALIKKMRPAWASNDNLVIRDGEQIEHVLRRHPSKGAMWVDFRDLGSEFTIDTVADVLAACADPRVDSW